MDQEFQRHFETQAFQNAWASVGGGLRVESINAIRPRRGTRPGGDIQDTHLRHTQHLVRTREQNCRQTQSTQLTRREVIARSASVPVVRLREKFRMVPTWKRTSKRPGPTAPTDSCRWSSTFTAEI